MTGLELEIAIRVRLKDGSPASIALVNLVGTRIDWGIRPGAALPALILQRLPGDIARHFKGESLQETRVQVDAWAADYATAGRIVHLVKTILEPAAEIAALPPNMEAGVRFERSFAEQPDPSYEETPTGIVHRARMDVMVWWALAA